MRRERSLSEGRKLNIQSLPADRNELQLLGSFTCPKVGTWDRLFDFSFEGRHAEDFYIRKIRRLRPRLNPRTRVQHVSEGKVEGKRKWGRRYKQLLDDLSEKRRDGSFKEEALGRTLWGTRFVPVARETCYASQYNILHSPTRDLQMSYDTAK
jgi:hypothetical protein